MKVISGKAIAFTLIACIFVSSLRAQTIVPKHEVGFGAGIFVYQGDFTPEATGAFKTPGPGY